MYSKPEKQDKKVGLIPRLARRIGERSVSQTCAWWANQPKVPESMKNNKN